MKPVTGWILIALCIAVVTIASALTFTANSSCSTNYTLDTNDLGIICTNPFGMVSIGVHDDVMIHKEKVNLSIIALSSEEFTAGEIWYSLNDGSYIYSKQFYPELKEGSAEIWENVVEMTVPDAKGADCKFKANLTGTNTSLIAYSKEMNIA